MIIAFTGKTGSGKTFHMIKEAYAAWRSGMDIYSNTMLFFTKERITNKRINIIDYPEYFSIFEKFRWSIYQFFYLNVFKKEIEDIIMPEKGKIVYFTDIMEILHIQNGLVLFDEGQVLFNARNWESLPYEFQYKLQQHRKHNLTLITTCQNLGTIDITYRRLIHQWVHCEKSIGIGENPCFWRLYRLKYKDVDELYNNVDDLKVPDTGSSLKIISRWSPVLYDTYYDIGFKILKSVCLNLFDSKTNQMKRKVFIIPKQMSLQDAQRKISILKSQFGQSRKSFSS